LFSQNETQREPPPALRSRPIKTAAKTAKTEVNQTLYAISFEIVENILSNKEEKRK
jgi:hypothetical protein